MTISRRWFHYRTYAWMNSKFGKPMPDMTNLCRYFWPAIFSVLFFPAGYAIFLIIKWPVIVVTSPVWAPIWYAISALKGRGKPALVPVKPKPAPTVIEGQVLTAKILKKSCLAWLRRLGLALKWLVLLPVRLVKLLGKIRIRRREPQPLPEWVATEICQLRKEFAKNLFRLATGFFVISCLAWLLTIIVLAALRTSHLFIHPIYLTALVLYLFFWASMLYTETFSDSLQYGAGPMEANDRWFTYRHRKFVEFFNGAMGDLQDIGKLTREFLIAKKQKICPIVNFVD